jgi:hypothetical protein
MFTDAHNVDGRADIYSLGRVVCWAKEIILEPNIQKEVSGYWRNFVKQSTELNKENRFQDIDELFKGLSQVENLMSIKTNPSHSVSYDRTCPKCGSQETSLLACKKDGQLKYDSVRRVIIFLEQF